LLNYRAWVQKMADELDDETAKYEKAHKVDGAPFVVEVTYRQVASIIAALDYVIGKRPAAAEPPVDPVQADLQLIAGLARRFHEAVLSLQKHPHGGKLFEVADEWDSQYLFRSILAAYFPDVREEEWSPSVAGSAGRCEFFIKPLGVMIELKYARKATDAKKFKTELATDFLDYGANPQVRRVIFLVYDPKSVIKGPAAFQADLSGPKTNLDHVDVICRRRGIKANATSLYRETKSPDRLAKRTTASRNVLSRPGRSDSATRQLRNLGSDRESDLGHPDLFLLEQH
jgi:hypothetical protein